MKNLNLDPSFKPFGPSIAFETFTFNGGEPHIKIKTNLDISEMVNITTRIKSFNDLGLLLLANDALRRMGIKTINLFLPYFPGARQDRVMIPGEPLTVKVYAEIINKAGFNRVTIVDPHSEVCSALLNQVSPFSNHKLVEKCVEGLENYLLVAPDGGALKKMHQLSTYLGGVPIIACNKERNVRTGALSGFTVYADDLKGQTCVIVDDICDGGGTFLGIAEALKDKNAGNIFLIVTHGIFSKGFEALQKHFSTIYCSDAFSTINHPALVQIKWADLI